MAQFRDINSDWNNDPPTIWEDHNRTKARRGAQQQFVPTNDVTCERTHDSHPASSLDKAAERVSILTLGARPNELGQIKHKKRTVPNGRGTIKQCLTNLAKRAVPNELGTKRAVPNELGTTRRSLQFNGQPIRRARLSLQYLDALCIRLELDTKRTVPNELGTTRRSLQFNGQPIRRARLSHQCLDALCIRLD